MEQSDIVTGTARDFANNDPQAAIEWSQRIGSHKAISAAMDRWCENDLQAATTWLRSNPNHASYGDSVDVLIGHLMPDDPESARAWAKSIPDETTRARVLGRLPAPE